MLCPLYSGLVQVLKVNCKVDCGNICTICMGCTSICRHTICRLRNIARNTLAPNNLRSLCILVLCLQSTLSVGLSGLITHSKRIPYICYMQTLYSVSMISIRDKDCAEWKLMNPSLGFLFFCHCEVRGLAKGSWY